jgi:head-tail adaptor
MTSVHLNRLLKLEHAVSAPDGAGGLSITWQEIGTIWGEILPGAGRDASGEEVTLSSVSYRIIVRASPDSSARRPKAGQRFTEGNRVFAVLAVTERDRSGHYLTCFTREETPQ